MTAAGEDYVEHLHEVTHLLSLVLANCSDLTKDPSTVACLLQTCSSWKNEVQRCTTAATHIEGFSCMKGLTAFAAWLPAYASLVGSLHLHLHNEARLCTARHVSRAVELLSNSLQLSASKTATMTGAAAATQQQNLTPVTATAASRNAVTAATGRGQMFPLRLKAYSSDFLHSVSVLEALPAASLTSLQLHMLLADSITLNSPSLGPALERFSKLQELSLAGGGSAQQQQLPASIIDAICCLRCITCLMLADVCITPAVLLRLPQTLTFLKVSSVSTTQQHSDGVMLGSSSTATSSVLDFTNLSNLRQLDMAASSLRQHCMLPPQVTSLSLLCAEGPAAGLDILALRNLQRLRLQQSQEGPHWLQQLTQCCSLADMEISYSNTQAMLAAAHVWKELPSLHRLEVWDAGTGPAEWQQVMAGIAAATSLTALALHRMDVLQAAEPHGEPAALDGTEAWAIGVQLKQLTRLQSLSLRRVHLTQQDVLHIMDMNSLTQLSLASCGAAVVDGFATGWSSSLTKLQSLSIAGSVVRTSIA